MIFKKYLQILDKSIKKRAIKIEKRLRLVISSFFLSLLIFFSTFFYFDKAPIFIPLLLITTYFFTYFSLIEKIEKIGWLNLFLMPIMLTISFYVFYFLFPGRWLTRLPFIIIYSISIYAVLLCSNIFSVGIEKSLQLYRAAFSINFFYQTLISFLFFNIVFSLKEYFYINMILSGVITFFLSFQLFWTVKLDKNLDKKNLLFAFLISLIIAQLSALLSFIPLRSTSIALFLTATFYSLSGIIYNYLDKKLFKETIREYVFVWIFVLIITFFSISW
ncbi:MAG: hypothetical protein N2593_03940 [Patescibacteria group bacterium]|nr:hypothetical protein [Patescibacteria group bacterium]